MFDILGFRRLLSEVDVRDCVELIQRHFRAQVLQRRAEAQARAFFGADVAQGFTDFRWLLFADTVVFTAALLSPEDEAKFPGTNAACSTVYFFMCQTLLLECFQAGIPLRGSLACGDFYVGERNRIFAGKPFVDAHEAAERQAWSGCSLTKSATDAVAEMRRDDPRLFKRILLDWNVPLTSGGTTSTEVVDWACPDAEGVARLTDYSKEHCQQKFEAFGKRVLDAKAQQKLDNTYLFIQRCGSQPT